MSQNECTFTNADHQCENTARRTIKLSKGGAEHYCEDHFKRQYGKENLPDCEYCSKLTEKREIIDDRNGAYDCLCYDCDVYDAPLAETN